MAENFILIYLNLVLNSMRFCHFLFSNTKNKKLSQFTNVQKNYENTKCQCQKSSKTAHTKSVNSIQATVKHNEYASFFVYFAIMLREKAITGVK